MLVRGQTKENNERFFSRSKSRHKKGKEKCWYCGKIEHLKKDCWKRKESEENSTKESNLVVTNSSMTGQVLSIYSNLKYQEECKLDSSASHHMCSHKNWLFSDQVLMRV
jgi:ribosomal protein L15E